MYLRLAFYTTLYVLLYMLIESFAVLFPGRNAAGEEMATRWRRAHSYPGRAWNLIGCSIGPPGFPEAPNRSLGCAGASGGTGHTGSREPDPSQRGPRDVSTHACPDKYTGALLVPIVCMCLCMCM